PPGCGDPSPTTPAAKPGERKYGVFIDGKECRHKVLSSYQKLQLASCVIQCRKYNKTAPFGTQCLKLMKDSLQERQDSAPTMCRVGRCVGLRCVTGPTTQKCSVPKNSRDKRE
ncbi:hypothetical protein V5799_000289, partial [Amblyomma americanum]